MRQSPILTRIVCFLACFMVAGCMSVPQLTQPPLEMKFYMPEYDPPVVNISTLPVAIKVKNFTAATLYDSRAIVYREKKFQTNEYVYHKWHLRPAEIVAQLIARDVRHSGVFKVVIPPDSSEPARYSLEGHIEKFQEDDGKDRQWYAELALDITLCDENETDVDKRILFQKFYQASEPCNHKNPAALTEAFSLALQSVSTQIITDVAGALKDRP